MSPLGVLQRPCSTSTRLQRGHAEYTASGDFGVTDTNNVQKIRNMKAKVRIGEEYITVHFFISFFATLYCY